MAPAKGNKPDINPWAWIVTVDSDDIGLEHVLRAYRIIDFKPCEETRRNCRKNPFCYWGMGEKKWVQDAEDGSADEDNGLREEGEFAGLQNLGATCYVNSLLQLWYHNPILRPAILRWEPSDIKDIAAYRPSGPIAQLQAMFARMKISKKSKIDPTEFVASLKLDTTEQQDAQEFSKLFMDWIINGLNEYTDGAIREAVASTFRGELQNETECTGCKNKTKRQESFSELELGVRKNLGDSLDELLKEEVLTGSEQYFCSVCQKKNDAIRRTQLLTLPPVLNLQLMRFVFDRETYRKKKVTTNIQFPEVLDMTQRIFKNADNNGESEAVVYHLSAVLIHNGPSASSGHYVAQVKDLRTGIWHKFNDENVDRVSKTKSPKLVLKEDEVNEGSGSDTEKLKSKKNRTLGNHNSQGAYMLVYTLDRYIKHPEPDPELWPYLEELIKQEDSVYEDDIRKSKNDKDYENNLREQRKREISVIYPNLKINGKKENNTSEVEDCEDQPPKKKPTRTEVNGISSKSPQANENGRNSDSSNECNDVEMEDFTIKKDDPVPLLNKAAREEIKDVKPLLATVTVKETSDPQPMSAATVRKLKPIQASKPLPVAAREKNKLTKLFPTLSNLNTLFNHENFKEMVQNVDFISADWMQQWLDGNNPPPPMENKILCCMHGKLRPPSPNSGSCLYKAVPSNFADELYSHYTIDGPRFRGEDAFCWVCVAAECKRMRRFHDLENDFKTFTELNKKFDVILASKVANKDNFEGCWISKESARSWKRVTKLMIEKQFRLLNPIDKIDQDAETQEDSDSSSMQLNADLLCPHDKLDSNDGIRKLIPISSWEIVAKYYPEAKKIPYQEKALCEDCLNEKKGDSEQRSKNKEIAASQKAKLTDLYLGRNRPQIGLNESVYVVSRIFVDQWRRFIKESTKTDPLKNINNSSLQCEHDKFMYPLNYLADIVKDVKPEKEMLCLVHPEEWTIIKQTFNVDNEIEIRTLNGNPLTLEYHPGIEICQGCATEWWFNTYRQKFEYTNEVIYVVRREKDEIALQQSDEDEDDLFTPVQTGGNGKRDRKRRDLSVYNKPNYLSTMGNTPTSNPVGRKMRPRKKKSEKAYKVSSTTTIKELKLLIVKDFPAILSDQHLFYKELELTDEAATLGDLQIAPKSILHLEIDTEHKDDDDPVPSSVETGFVGTILMGNNITSHDANMDCTETQAQPEIPTTNGEDTKII